MMCNMASVKDYKKALQTGAGSIQMSLYRIDRLHDNIIIIVKLNNLEKQLF